MTTPHPALLDLVAGRDVGRPLDEAALLSSAGEHRMVSAVLGAQDEGRIDLSLDARTTLGVWELSERATHLGFWRTLSEVRERLAPLAVDVAVLKGIATEARWYDDVGQRVSTDLDLLLDPAALPRLAEIIEALDPGYGPRIAAAVLAQRRVLPHVDLHVGSTQVDLHLDALKVGMAMRQRQGVWDSTEELSTAEGTIRVLAPEVELVLLLLHLNKDGFAYLGAFLDIGRIIDRGSLDWDQVAAFAAAEGLEVPVGCSLHKVAATLDRDVPVPRPRGPRARSWARLWGPGRGLGGAEGRIAAKRPQKVLPLHARGRLREALGSLQRDLLPQRQLLEVAGRVGPDDSYVRHLAGAATRRILPGPDPGPITTPGTDPAPQRTVPTVRRHP